MPDQPVEPADEPTDGSAEPVDDSRDPVQRPVEPPPQPAAGPTAFADSVRAKFEEYDVEGHLGDFAAQVEHAVRQGVESVGALAHEHRDDIEGFLSRTAEALDRRTDGRHAETISQVREQIERGVQRLAEQRPPDPPGPPDPAEPDGEV